MRKSGLIRVRSLSGQRQTGHIEHGAWRAACALGGAGTRWRKREGDNATPAGTYRLLGVLYRADRVSRPRSCLPMRALRPNDGWCDAPGDRNYNRSVRLPYPASAEQMWRADGLYDIVVVLSHNRRPRVRGAGSAIFIHLARPGYEPTAGCIALDERDLRHVLARLERGATIRIGM